MTSISREVAVASTCCALLLLPLLPIVVSERGSADVTSTGVIRLFLPGGCCWLVPTAALVDAKEFNTSPGDLLLLALFILPGLALATCSSVGVMRLR